MKLRKRNIIYCMLAAALNFSLTGCGSPASGAVQPGTGNQSIDATEDTGAAGQDSADQPEDSDEGIDGAEYASSAGQGEGEEGGAQESASAGTETEPGTGSDILIVYFTAAENSGVDAVASASYSMRNGEAVGRLRILADMIQENTGGDLFSIQTDVVYPADGGELIDYAAQEQDEDARPGLTTHIENPDSYKTVFIGYPNWWADMPQALYSFFDEYDFSGKTIIPFNVHNGSRFSQTISTIRNLEPDAEVIEDGFTISERDVAEADEEVADWLENLEF